MSNSSIHRNASQLASLLAVSGADKMGTLPLKGIFNQPDKSRIAFLFEFPEKTQREPPSSLHELLLQRNKNISPVLELGMRFKIAHFLAKTLRMLHIHSWIHKNLSSHTLVFFKDRQEGNHVYQQPFLVDFEFSRPDTGSSLCITDNDPERNLYRRPKIQILDRPAFSRRDDLYSLGAVPLEITVWQTALEIIDEYITDPQRHSNPDNIHNLYLAVAKQCVPAEMGNAFTSAVLACLTDELEDKIFSAEFPEVSSEKLCSNWWPIWEGFAIREIVV
ncbi:hypothetical protein N7493_009215 [Penicillium malachiteum]|uniref:Protein kinase domain-containing protein n=1 Tax=Penicillium malachiteum TaxID=1324776 RepID=A0AAD6HG21_9EURO|nr:hypothetical protein N7493_009215 [Penicillium malachiteum]